MNETVIAKKQPQKIMSVPVIFLKYLFIIVVCMCFFFPFYWMFVTAVKPTGEIFAYPPRLWPSEIHWENFIESLSSQRFDIFFKNSTIVTLIATTITVAINLLAGFAFAKYTFKGKELFFMIVLSTLMVPIQATMIPNYIIVSRLKLLNTYAGLILPPCAEAFGIFLSRQFISEIPDDLIEASRLDGASEFTIFRCVIVPNVKPLVSVLIIFTFMWRWNDFQWPLILLSDSSMYTIQIGLSMLNATQYINWNTLMGASLITILPVVVIFLIFQKQFIQGVVSSGIKG